MDKCEACGREDNDIHPVEAYELDGELWILCSVHAPKTRPSMQPA